MDFEDELWCYPWSFSLYTMRSLVLVLWAAPPPHFLKFPMFLLITFSSIFLCHVQWRTKFRKAMNKADNDASTKAIDSLINYEVRLWCVFFGFFPCLCTVWQWCIILWRIFCLTLIWCLILLCYNLSFFPIVMVSTYLVFLLFPPVSARRSNISTTKLMKLTDMTST